MSFSILNNIPSLAAQNQLSMTHSSLQQSLFRLSSGSRINSGADDAAGLAIADGLHANISALNQSSQNATNGVGELQVADGALAQVTSLLNRAVTLATEASNGTVNTSQAQALDSEFTQIKNEINRIGSSTTYNGVGVFTGTTTVNDTNLYQSSAGSLTSATALTNTKTVSITDTDTGNVYTFTAGASSTVGDLISGINSATSAGTINVQASIVGGKVQIKDLNGNHSLYVTTNDAALGSSFAASQVSVNTSAVYLSDGTSGNGNTISTTINALSATALSLNTDNLQSNSSAQTALTDIVAAVANVAGQRGQIGASINRLQAASNVINAQVQNLSQAEDNLRAADIPSEVANMTKFNILNQTGMSALAQANQMQQSVLKLLQ
jgi:flagellin